MIWAVKNSERVSAKPGERAECPCCHGEVLAKCGKIVTWHWAHTTHDCDPWYDPESTWHIGWKLMFPDEYQEVVIGKHRADIKTPKLVVELQRSAITAEEIQERERHYRNMVWLVYGKDFYKNLHLWKYRGVVFFNWRWPRKTWWHAKMPTVIDFGRSELLLIKSLHDNSPIEGHWEPEKYGGTGTWITKAEFLIRCGIPAKN